MAVSTKAALSEKQQTKSASQLAREQKNITANATTAYSVPPGPIQLYLEKFKEWKFNFPSKNLWTVEIRLHNDGKSTSAHSLLSLFKNIDSANRRWKAMIGNTWAVTNRTGDVDFANTFLNRFQSDQTALFLAQGVGFAYRGANISTNVSDSIATYTGFVKYGMVEQGANYNPTCRIQFYETNWDLGDVLFDKWIAAVSQQGLIEDSSLPCIKADIVINYYSAGIQKTKEMVAYHTAQQQQLNLNNKAQSTPQQVKQAVKDNAGWTLRKTVTLYSAVPTQREGTENVSYENNGPTVETVSFNYLDYRIDYMI